MEAAGQQGYRAIIQSPDRLSALSSEGRSHFWVEKVGQLSDPLSGLNQALDLIGAGLAEIGFVPGSPPPPPVHRHRRITKRLSEAEIDEMVMVYQAGSSLAQTAKQFGVHWYTVQQHLKRRGVPRRPPAARKLTDEQAQEIKRMHELGVTCNDLALQYGVSIDTIRRELHRAVD